jgi:hypothetical protein
MPETDRQPEILWDHGTAYDFFTSLAVIHSPSDYGLRASWAAGIRSRLSPPARELCASISPSFGVPLPWLYGITGPKTARAVLDRLESMKPEEILPTVFLNPRHPEECDAVFLDVLKRGKWTPADLDSCCSLMSHSGKKKAEDSRSLASRMLDAWAHPGRFGEQWCASLLEFYEVFYREEERRIVTDVERALARARDLASRLTVAELFEELSQGIRIADHFSFRSIVFVPCYWCSPRILYTMLAEDQEIVLFGARPPEASLIPGDAVPSRLLLALEAISDPTRLSILRAIIAEPLTQADIARRLRLRPPTISHHLKSLRIAGLIVHMGTEKEGLRYGARLPQIEQACVDLKEFLSIRSPG